jgi:5-methylcytosine-specific restriction endonuclease McrA
VRKEFSAAVRKAAKKRADGHCEGCKTPLKRFDYDHHIPLGLGGTSTLENCKVLCTGSATSCHAIKTKEDTAIMRKADAQRKYQDGTGRTKTKFAQKPKILREGKPSLPPRPLFGDIKS